MLEKVIFEIIKAGYCLEIDGYGDGFLCIILQDGGEVSSCNGTTVYSAIKTAWQKIQL